jgi:hypothetical protein
LSDCDLTDEQVAAVRSLMGQRRPGRPPKTEVLTGQPKKKRGAAYHKQQG